MKRYLFILIIFLPIALFGQSTTTDSVKVAVPALKKILVAAEQKKVLEQQVVILNDRIGVLQSQIDNLTLRDDATVQGYEAQIKLLNDEIAIHKNQVAAMEKIIKRQRRNAFWSKVGGGMTTAAALALFIIKK